MWRSSAATSDSPTPSSPIAQPVWPGHSVAEGRGSGDRVAFLSTNCHRLLEAYYGVLEADCVLLPLNVRLAPAELSYVLNDAGARFLFVEQALLPLAEAFRRDVPGIERIYLLDGAPQADWLSPHTYDELIATRRRSIATSWRWMRTRWRSSSTRAARAMRREASCSPTGTSTFTPCW